MFLYVAVLAVLYYLYTNKEHYTEVVPPPETWGIIIAGVLGFFLVFGVVLSLRGSK